MVATHDLVGAGRDRLLRVLDLFSGLNGWGDPFGYRRTGCMHAAQAAYWLGRQGTAAWTRGAVEAPGS